MEMKINYQLRPPTHPTTTHSARRRPHWQTLGAAFGLALALGSAAHAEPYTTSVVASGLTRPTGLVASMDEEIYFSEVPNPGKPNAGNTVKRLNLEDGKITTLHEGEPEPTNLALDRWGHLYWTCKSAGVILERDGDGNTTPLLGKLQKPSGIAIDRKGIVYFTEIPTPGIPGTIGGKNRVSAFDGTTTEVLHEGEPEPTDIASSRRGALYWTCKTAGVILFQNTSGKTTTLLSGLNKPVGIALNHRGTKLFWTEVPTPGVAGSKGGQNKVWELNLRTKVKTLVHSGDPEPTDVTVDREGAVYWTCSSAGVIIKATSTGRDRDDD